MALGLKDISGSSGRSRTIIVRQKKTFTPIQNTTERHGVKSVNAKSLMILMAVESSCSSHSLFPICHEAKSRRKKVCGPLGFTTANSYAAIDLRLDVFVLYLYKSKTGQGVRCHQHVSFKRFTYAFLK